MKRSPIAWTDYSGGNLNFVTGCTPVSAGCRECYARRLFERFGRDFAQVTTYPEKLARLRTQRFPEWSPKRGAPCGPMVFPVDMGDLFHEDVPEPFIAEALDVMAARDDVIWQVLTKRPARLRHMIWWLGECWPGDSPLNAVWEALGHWPANIWLGVTVEDQQAAEERIPMLLNTPAAVRWLSVEPMLGPVDMIAACDVVIGKDMDVPVVDGWGRWIDWVVCAAESGPNRRPFDVQWAVDLYEQCRYAGVPFFGKQASGVTPGTPLVLPGIGEVQQWPSTCAVCGGTIPIGETEMFEAATGRQAHMRCEVAFAAMAAQKEGGGGAE